MRQIERKGLLSSPFYLCKPQKPREVLYWINTVTSILIKIRLHSQCSLIRFLGELSNSRSGTLCLSCHVNMQTMTNKRRQNKRGNPPYRPYSRQGVILDRSRFCKVQQQPIPLRDFVHVDSPSGFPRVLIFHENIHETRVVILFADKPGCQKKLQRDLLENMPIWGPKSLTLHVSN